MRCALPVFLLPVAVAASDLTISPYKAEPSGTAWSVVESAMTELQHTDFSPPALQWSMADQKRGRLPVGWRDFSSPAATTRYGRMVDDGVPQLQWTVTTASPDAPARAGLSFGPVEPATTVRATITLRSLSRTPVTLLAYDAQHPETPLHSQSVTTDTGWEKQEFYWNATGRVENVIFALSTTRAVTLEISEFALQSVDTSALDRALAFSNASPLDKNLLRSTRFPLGLPPRWMIRSDLTLGDDLLVDADATLSGPSGSAPLKVTAKTASQLMGEPFSVLRPNSPHVASLAVRGTGGGELAVCSATQVLASCTFSGSDDWQRIALPFQSGSFATELYLRILVDADSTLWFDALRVGAGADARQYAGGWPAETSLAAVPADRIIFSDEPPGSQVVRWSVTGAPAGSRLRVKVVNLYGQQTVLPDVSLGEGPTTGTWSLPEFPDHPLGQHRFEVWVEDPDGTRLSAYQEIVIARLNRPRLWNQDAPQSPFGAHVPTSSHYMALAKAVGINWVRFHDGPQNRLTAWSSVEPQRGQWTFDDRAVQRYRDHHLMILGQLGAAPGWATALERVGPRDWLDRYYQPEDLHAFRNYVHVTTGHYRDEIHYWELWNEPWLTSFWKKDTGRDADGEIIVGAGDDPGGDYARLQKIAHEEVKAVDPQLTLVGFNTTGGNHAIPGRKIAGSEWTRLVRDGGGLKSADIVSYHQYAYEDGGYPGDSLETGFHTATDPLLDAQSHLPLPVWMTEGNVVQHLTNTGFYHQSLVFPQADNDRAVSDRLCRYTVAMLGAGAEKVFLYSMHKVGRQFDNGADYRVLLSEEGQLHPSAVAYSALTWRLEGKQFSKIIELTPDTRAYVFTGTDDWTAVMVPRPGSQSSVPLADFKSYELADIYGNPLPATGPAGSHIFYIGGKGTPDLIPTRPAHE